MSTRTTNLGLTKPDGEENVSRNVFNTNFDLIDTAVGGRVKTTDVVDNLTSAATDKPLSAYQGKVLQDGKLNKSDVINALTAVNTDKPLSAAMGNELLKMINAGAGSLIKNIKVYGGTVQIQANKEASSLTLYTETAGTFKKPVFIAMPSSNPSSRTQAYIISGNASYNEEADKATVTVMARRIDNSVMTTTINCSFRGILIDMN